MQSIHRVKGTAPWGDYGKILAHGMTAHLGRTPDGRLQLERTGPFLPAVTAPSFSVLVVASMRERIEAAGLTGVEFREVEKARIVRCDWERWDRKAPQPPELPQGGSPEGYVLQRPHDEALAAELGPVFEVLALGSCSIDVQKIAHPPAPDAAPWRNPFTGEAMPAHVITLKRSVVPPR